jgi:hypothetical protein
MLLELPESFLVLFFTQWIGVTEIARLDTACCEMSIREQFWKILSSTNVVLSAPALVLDSETDLLWLVC